MIALAIIREGFAKCRCGLTQSPCEPRDFVRVDLNQFVAAALQTTIADVAEPFRSGAFVACKVRRWAAPWLCREVCTSGSPNRLRHSEQLAILHHA
jgi:hypothetical protein